VLYQLLQKCHALAKGRTKFRFRNKLFSLDATVIELCASLFDWAKFRTTKGAVKLHLLLDHEGYLPVFAHITEGAVHEVNVARRLVLAKGSIVVIDRGYADYALFSRWTREEVYFVTRLKGNAAYRVVSERLVPANRNILRDQAIELTGFYSRRKCPHVLRRIEVWDKDTEQVIVLLSNHHEFGATTIASTYKDRWQIETFFQDDQAEPEDQDLCRDFCQCADDTDLDSIDCDPCAEVPEVPVTVCLVVVQPGGDAAV
jgi:hypothetical protein